jgi:hypothetical protein
VLTLCDFTQTKQLKAGDHLTENGGRFGVFTVVTMKNAVFWDVTPFLQDPHGITSQKTAFFFQKIVLKFPVFLPVVTACFPVMLCHICPHSALLEALCSVSDPC